MKKHIHINFAEILQRTICLVLASVMLCNLTVEAMPKPESSAVRQQIAAEIEKQVSSQKNPKETLQFLNKQLKQAFVEDTNSNTPSAANEEFQELQRVQSFAEFKQEYDKQADAVYQQELKALEKEYEQQVASVKEAVAGMRAQARQEAGAADAQLAIYEASLYDQQDQILNQYKEELAQAKEQLQNEVTKYKNNVKKAHAEYKQEFEKVQQEAAGELINALHEIVITATNAHKDVFGYGKGPRLEDADRTKQDRKVADEEFFSIIGILSSMKDKDKIFANTDLVYIRDTFLGKFIKSGACGTHQETHYDPNADYNVSAYAPMGGSPSAAKMFAVQSAKRYTVELNNEEACNLALSSLIPFANLNGSSSRISNFIKSHVEYGSFGSVLLVGAKAILMTSDRERMATFAALVNSAVARENKARQGSWTDVLDYMTLEGISRAFMDATKKGPYGKDNVVLAASQGSGQPNVWEDVAQMLSDEMKAGNTSAKNILKSAIDQCVLDVKDDKQVLRCQGIYPFLLGVLEYAPELAETLKVNPFPNHPLRAGDTFTSDGHVRYVSEEEASQHRKWVAEHDILKKYTKAELLGMHFFNNIFAGQTAEDKYRIDNIIVASSILNPQKRMHYYTKTGAKYQSITNKVNLSVMMTALTSYFDFLISLYLIVDLGVGLVKIGGTLKSLASIKDVRKIIVSFKLMPTVGLGKGVKILRAFEAAKLSPQILVKMNKWNKRIKKFRTFKTNALVTFRDAFAVQYTFKPFLPKTNLAAPISKATANYVATAAKANGLRPITTRIGVANNAGIHAPHNMAKGISYLAQSAAGAGNLAAGARTLDPIAKLKLTDLKLDAKSLIAKNTVESKGATDLNIEGITVKYFGDIVNKDGQKVRELKDVTKLGVKDGVLYVNDEMLKTFKAYVSLDQVETLASIAKANGIPFEFEGVWVRLLKEADLPGTVKASSGADKVQMVVGEANRGGKRKTLLQKHAELNEKMAGFNREVVTVPLYDQTGTQQILAVGLNPGYKEQAALLKKLAPEAVNAPKQNKLFAKLKGKFSKKGKEAAQAQAAADVAAPQAKLLLKDGKIYMLEGEKLVLLDEYKAVGIPKTVFSYVGDVKKNGEKGVNFLNQLFAMNAGKAGGVTLYQTKDKLAVPMLINMLSYSASASALTMTLENQGWSAVESTAVGLGLPYISAILAPFLAPLVMRFGARSVLMYSMGLALTSLSFAMGSGWDGHGFQIDPKTGKQRGKEWVLFLNAVLTGMAATGVRASSNALLKAYETCENSMVKSMAFKSIGGMLTTLVPVVAHYWHHGTWSKEVPNKDDKVDFSAAYWVLAGATLAAMIGLYARFPKRPGMSAVKETADAAEAAKKESYIKQAWGTLTPKKLLPYVGGITLMSSLEGYIYFKGINALYRDEVNSWGASETNAKAISSLFTAIPQVFWRLGGIGKKVRWGKRTSNFGEGIFMSVLASSAGAGLFLIPSTGNKAADIPLGLLSGLLIGSGTANIFQYTQKLTWARADALKIERPMATTVFSMGNLGLALPLIPSVYAQKLKEEDHSRKDLDSTRDSSWIPLIFYGLGAAWVLKAEAFPMGVIGRLRQMGELPKASSLATKAAELRLLNAANWGRRVSQYRSGSLLKGTTGAVEGGFVGGTVTNSDVSNNPYAKLRLLPAAQNVLQERDLLQEMEQEDLEEPVLQGAN